MKVVTKDLTVPEVYLPLFQAKTAENVLLWGGRGAGRSYTAAYKVVLFCLGKPDDCTFFVGRYYKDDIEKSVFRQIRIAIKDLGVQTEEFSKDRIKLRGGCEIRFESFKDELNLRSSPKTIGVWYEEAQQADNVINLVNLRATARRVPDCFLFIATMNRTKPNDAMYEMFKRLDDKEKLVIYACVWDNTFASGSVMKEWEDAKKQLECGDITQDEYDLVWRGLPNMDGERSFYKYSFLEASKDSGEGLLNDEVYLGKVAGVDLAYGGTDLCVYTEMEVYADKRRKVVRAESWKPISNKDTAGRITQFIREGNVSICGIDGGDGGGKGIYEDVSGNFGRSDIEIVRYVPGVPLKNTVVAGLMAANMRAYSHMKLRNDLELGYVFGVPGRYVDVMANIWKTSTREGKVYIESKEENRKHTGRSPDENDSLVICNEMANKMLKNSNGDSVLNNKIKSLQNVSNFGRIGGMISKGKKGLPKWL